MKKSNFDQLMHRYVAGKVSDYERAKIEAWLKVMKAERAGDLGLSKETEERLFQKITSTGDSVRDVIAMYPRQPLVRRLVSRQWFQIAASVTVLLCVAFATWYVLEKASPLKVVASEAREKLILNDGTLVWLQQGSTFTYFQDEKGTRNARLNGEALFEVAKIPNSPFTIACGDINVKVLGTSFTLKTEAEGIQLKVLTGNVNLSTAKDATGINVSPHENVRYTLTGEVEREKFGGGEVTTITRDTEYNMEFENATMDKVVERIEKKFDVGVNVENSELLRCRVTVDLTDNSLSNTLAMLNDLLNISFKINGSEVELSGKGCD